VSTGPSATAGDSFRLKNSKGLGYLALYLPRHPGAEFNVLDLEGGIASQREEDDTGHSAHGLPRLYEDLERAGIHITRLGDADEMLDERAKVAYRRRLSDLHEELENAKELGNVERAQRAEDEIDAVTRELSRVVGLGDAIAGRRPLRSEPGKASPRRSGIGRSFTELTAAFIWAGRFQEAGDVARRALALLLAGVSPDRAHLLGALGQANATAGA
jgi:hypothetical protein